jgi:hypothetical protein
LNRQPLEIFFRHQWASKLGGILQTANVFLLNCSDAKKYSYGNCIADKNSLPKWNTKN